MKTGADSSQRARFMQKILCMKLYFLLQVTELTSRSALLQWSPPERFSEASTLEGKGSECDFSEADLRYEVLLSDKGKEGKYKSIYSGISLSCRYETI